MPNFPIEVWYLLQVVIFSRLLRFIFYFFFLCIWAQLPAASNKKTTRFNNCFHMTRWDIKKGSKICDHHWIFSLLHNENEKKRTNKKPKFLPFQFSIYWFLQLHQKWADKSQIYLFHISHIILWSFCSKNDILAKHFINCNKCFVVNFVGLFYFSSLFGLKLNNYFLYSKI